MGPSHFWTWPDFLGLSTVLSVVGILTLQKRFPRSCKFKFKNLSVYKLNQKNKHIFGRLCFEDKNVIGDNAALSGLHWDWALFLRVFSVILIKKRRKKKQYSRLIRQLVGLYFFFISTIKLRILYSDIICKETKTLVFRLRYGRNGILDIKIFSNIIGCQFVYWFFQYYTNWYYVNGLY